MTALLENTLLRVFNFNSCVTANELRMRMRGARPFLVLLVYSLIATGAVLLAILIASLERRFMGGPQSSDLGRTAFAVLAHTQLTLIFLIVPAYAAGAITMEREKRTLEMLKASLVTPGDVVTGKLLVTLAFGLVLLLTSLPVAAWCMLLGGLAPEELFYVYAYLFLVAAFVSTVGLFFSSLLNRSMGAIVLTYGVLIALGVLSSMVPGLVIMVVAISSGGPTGAAAFGPSAALVILLLFGLLSAWLVFLALRWLLTRLLRRRGPRSIVLLAALAGLLWLAVLMFPLGPVYSVVEQASVAWVMLANPYVSLTAIMSGGFAEFLIATGAGGPHAPPSAHLDLYIWLVAALILSTFAAGLWLLAIRIHRVRA